MFFSSTLSVPVLTTATLTSQCTRFIHLLHTYFSNSHCHYTLTSQIVIVTTIDISWVNLSNPSSLNTFCLCHFQLTRNVQNKSNHFICSAVLHHHLGAGIQNMLTTRRFVWLSQLLELQNTMNRVLFANKLLHHQLHHWLEFPMFPRILLKLGCCESVPKCVKIKCLTGL